MDKGFNIVKITLLFLSLNCALIISAQETIKVKITKINSSNDEYAPVYYKDGLVYSSAGAIDESKNLMTGLFFSPFKKGKLAGKSVFSGALKTGLHEGAITFNAEGTVAFFTRTQNEGIVEVGDSITTESKLGVYRTTFDGKKWGNITPCNFNQPEFSFGHPSLSRDGKRLYITSEITGGYGGKDLYYCELTDGVCGPLINLGDKINTPSNEVFPFIDQNNRLYYASDKKGGMGGLDVYYSDSENKIWSNPIALDEPINSKFDDFSITWHNNGIEGYFSSNRNGSDDIFKIIISIPETDQCEEMDQEQLCYDFFEEATIYVDTTEMLYTWDFGDGTKTNELGPYHCFPKFGKYTVTLTIYDQIIADLYIEKDAFEIDIKEVIQPIINLQENLKVGEEFSIDVNQGKWLAYPIESFYIDYGDETQTKNSTLPHQYALPGEYEIKVTIAGINAKTKKFGSDCFFKKITVSN